MKSMIDKKGPDEGCVALNKEKSDNERNWLKNRKRWQLTRSHFFRVFGLLTAVKRETEGDSNWTRAEWRVGGGGELNGSESSKNWWTLIIITSEWDMSSRQVVSGPCLFGELQKGRVFCWWHRCDPCHVRRLTSPVSRFSPLARDLIVRRNLMEAWAAARVGLMNLTLHLAAVKI